MTVGISYAVEYETSTGKEDIVFTSTDKEVTLGDSLDKSVEKRFQVVRDAAAQKKFNEIGQKIAAVCDRRDIIYHFKVITDRKSDTPIINAFSLPGGYVYIFEDLYDKLKGDDNELAAVIAHEVGHIVARHGVKRMQSAYGANILLILASQAQRSPGTVGKAYEAINSLMTNYSREDEFFADKCSVKYAKKAGYDPEGVVKVLQLLWNEEKNGPTRTYVDDPDHPYLSIRIARVKQEIYGTMDFVDYINIPAEKTRR